MNEIMEGIWLKAKYDNNFLALDIEAVKIHSLYLAQRKLFHETLIAETHAMEELYHKLLAERYVEYLKKQEART